MFYRSRGIKIKAVLATNPNKASAIDSFFCFNTLKYANHSAIKESGKNTTIVFNESSISVIPVQPKKALYTGMLVP
jgi:hypothetical protein